MSRPVARRTATAVVAVVAAGSLAGCEFRGAESIPLPGGQGNGADAYSFQVEFPDVLDLVPQAAVKVADVTVGSVGGIELDGYTARVEVRVNGDVEVPANSSISLRQSSLLGEKFISIDPPPAGEATGRIEEGDLIGVDRTSRSVEVEEVLSALSLVLNGGSLEQLQVINSELVNALEGREDRVRSLLQQLDVFVTGLDDQKQDIVRVLDSLDRLSTRLVDQRQTIAVALDDIPAGVQVLSDQREELVQLLVGLDRLGDVAVRTINASQENTVASLRALEPILRQLSAAGADLPNALELLTTYPFPRTVTDGIKGDYANLFVTLDLDVNDIGRFLGLPPLLPSPEGGDPIAPGAPNPLLPLPLPGTAETPPPAAPPGSPAPAPAPSGPSLPIPELPGLTGSTTSSTDGGGLLRMLLGGLR